MTKFLTVLKKHYFCSLILNNYLEDEKNLSTLQKKTKEQTWFQSQVIKC